MRSVPYFAALTSLLFGATCLTGCQPGQSLRLHYPGIYFDEGPRGDFLRSLEVDDVRRMTDLVRNRKDIVKPITRITMVGQDRAELYTGEEPPTFKKFIHTRLTVYKYGADWKIDEETVKQEEATMGSDDQQVVE